MKKKQQLIAELGIKLVLIRQMRAYCNDAEIEIVERIKLLQEIKEE